MEKNVSNRSIMEVITDYVSRRDHSERELRLKLKRKGFEPIMIDAGIIKAKEYRMLADPQSLAERLTESLSRRGKSHMYIQNYLRSKGLPSTSANEEVELENAKRAMAKRFPFGRGLSSDQKIYQFLRTRGFSSSVISKIMKRSIEE